MSVFIVLIVSPMFKQADENFVNTLLHVFFCAGIQFTIISKDEVIYGESLNFAFCLQTSQVEQLFITMVAVGDAYIAVLKGNG